MANVGGIVAVPDPSTIGMPASFEFPSNVVFPGATLPTMTGSQLGVPPNEYIAGNTPQGSGSAADASAYADSKAGAPAHSQPLFWSVVLVVAGVVIISHVAHVGLRGE